MKVFLVQWHRRMIDEENTDGFIGIFKTYDESFQEGHAFVSRFSLAITGNITYSIREVDLDA